MTEQIFNGTRFWFFTTYELRKILRVSRRTLSRWQQRGIIPPPLVKVPRITGLGRFDKRLFWEEHGILLAKWVDFHRLGRRGYRIKDSVIAALHKDWAKVTEEFRVRGKGVY